MSIKTPTYIPPTGIPVKPTNYIPPQPNLFVSLLPLEGAVAGYAMSRYRNMGANQTLLAIGIGLVMGVMSRNLINHRPILQLMAF